MTQRFIKSITTILQVIILSRAVVHSAAFHNLKASAPLTDTVGTCLRTDMTKAPCDESAEVLSTWAGRWAENKIAWHKEETNPALLKYLPSIINSLQASPNRNKEGLRVLVPLCGKTVDLTYLANHESISEVVGVDGVQKSLDEFLNENSELNIKESPFVSCEADTPFRNLEGDGITLLKGNFFELDDATAGGKFDLIWDRGSIVAISPDNRPEYVAAITRVLKPGGIILFVTVDRREGTEEAMKMGPPFTVTNDDLKIMFKPLVDTCELIEEVDEVISDPAGAQKFVDAGLTSFFQVVSMMKAKSNGV